MIITPDIFAKVYYGSEISDLEEKAKEQCVKLSGFSVNWETDNIELLKNLMRDRLITCACGKSNKVVKYYIIAWGGVIEFKPYPPVDVIDNHIQKLKLIALREVLDKYQQIVVCCVCGGVVDSETGICKLCGMKYNKIKIPISIKL